MGRFTGTAEARRLTRCINPACTSAAGRIRHRENRPETIRRQQTGHAVGNLSTEQGLKHKVGLSPVNSLRKPVENLPSERGFDSTLGWQSTGTVRTLIKGYLKAIQFDAATRSNLGSRPGQRDASDRHQLHKERDNTRHAYTGNRHLRLRKIALSIPESLDRSGGIQ